MARRTTYYKPTRSPAKVKRELAKPIKGMIEAEPSFGYRTVAALLGMNKNNVQRIKGQGGKDGGLSLARVIACSTRHFLSGICHGPARVVRRSPALEQVLLTCLVALGREPESFLLRSDNGLAFNSHHYTCLVRSYGLK